MKKTQLTSYDQTKKMLNTLRKLNEDQVQKNSINEGYQFPEQEQQTTNHTQEEQPNPETSQPQQNNFVVINDVDVKLLSSDEMDMKLSEEQKTAISGIIDTFRQQVSQTAVLEPGFTLSPAQIRFDGELGEYDMRFTFVVGEEQGTYVNCEMTPVTPEMIDVLNKMNKFDQMYKDALSVLISQRQNN